MPFISSSKILEIKFRPWLKSPSRACRLTTNRDRVTLPVLLTGPFAWTKTRGRDRERQRTSSTKATEM
eukprot:2947337-Rhodomonas_salina.1